MSRSAGFLRSMTGRIFLLLLPGVLLSSLIALGIADLKWRDQLDRAHLERVADHASDFIDLLNNTPAPMRVNLARQQDPGVAFAPANVEPVRDQPGLAALLMARRHTHASAGIAPTAACMRPPPGFHFRKHPGLRPPFRPPQCWIVAATLNDGSTVRLIVSTPPPAEGERRGIDPFYLLIFALGVAIVAAIVARAAAAPINALGAAARALGADLNQVPLVETGPSEVRDAIRAFNVMQQRLQSSLTERTQMLGAISHDLQTPVTRLRLRLEKVEDTELRVRLIADLAAMQALITEGLDLARSTGANEPFAVVDVDALLESLVEDAVELGGEARLANRSGVDVQVRPMALRRCLSNLIDNAIKYGAAAEVSTTVRQDVLTIAVRDRGPGIPPDDLVRVFDPFVRLETSRSRETGGAGLGLSIARTLAEKCNAVLVLRNHSSGGLEAALELAVFEAPR